MRSQPTSPSPTIHALLGMWSGEFIPSGSILDFMLHLSLEENDLHAGAEIGGKRAANVVAVALENGVLSLAASVSGAQVHFKGKLEDGVLAGTFEALKHDDVVEVGQWRLCRGSRGIRWSPDPVPPARGTSLSWLPPRWEELMRANRVPGMALVAVRGDDIVLLEALGQRDRALPVTPDTCFYLASSTKSFVAMAIVLLAEEGKIDLDTPVRAYLPRFRLSADEATRRTTVRDLLCHRRGIVSREIDQGEAYGNLSEEGFFELLGRVTPLERFEYTNVHYTLLGRILATVTGGSWKQVVQERILNPAGMFSTTMSADSLFTGDNVALPFEEVDGELRVCLARKSDQTMHAAGGLASSVRDLSIWLRLNLSEGKLDDRQIVPAAVVHQMTREAAQVRGSFYEFRRTGYGLGWYIGSYKQQRLVHHFGSYDGARAHISFMPERSIGVAVVANASGPSSYLPDLVASELYDAMLGFENDQRWRIFTRQVDIRRRKGVMLQQEGSSGTR